MRDCILVASLVLSYVGLGLSCIAPPQPATPAPTTATPIVGSCRCGVKGGSMTKIVGGQNADKNEYPWQAGTRISPKN